jgi:hypothetical protein
MNDLRKQITLTVVENAMIDIDNTGQERYTFNEEQFGLLIDNLVKNLALFGVRQQRELLKAFLQYVNCSDTDSKVSFDLLDKYLNSL